MRLILASGSPRRKELLGYLNKPFEIMTADVDETINHDNDLRKEIEKLSFKKANAVFENNKDAIVIGADTIVTINNQILGKPHTKEKAFEMLKMLSNNCHQVITGVTIITPTNTETFSTVSNVYFYEMSDQEIQTYVDSEEPLDKAGAYAIQGGASKFISHIEGDYFSIMGLPVGELFQRLKKYC